MPRLRRLILLSSVLVISIEAAMLFHFWQPVVDWVSHHLWVVLLPMLKGLFKRAFAVKLISLFKSIWILLWHVSKLLLLKLLKTLGVRYGVFFSQYRWYWIRRARIMFIRRGKQFFRSQRRFWLTFSQWQKWLVLIAFFPAVVVLFFLGLSFNVTRKTMVHKTQETAVFKMAANASKTSIGIRDWLNGLDQATLKRIQLLTAKYRQSPDTGASVESLTPDDQEKV